MDYYSALDERARALSVVGTSAAPPATSADIEALVYATVYVGDQLKRLADMVEGGFDLTRIARYLSRDPESEHVGYVEPRRAT